MTDKIVDGTDRPFYQRTEFYLMLAAIIVGGLLGSGILGDGSTVHRALGMVVEALAAIGYTAGRALFKAGTGMEGRPGFKTTEFWSTLTASGLLLVQSMDVVAPDSPLGTILAAVLTALPGAGYSVARGKVKGAALLPLLLLCILPACSTPQQTTMRVLAESHKVLKASSQVGERVIGDQCRQAALTCRDQRRAAEAAGDAAAASTARECQPLVSCHQQLQTFNTAVIAGQLGVADGLVLLELGEAAAAKQLPRILAKVRAAIAAAERTITEMEARR